MTTGKNPGNPLALIIEDDLEHLDIFIQALGMAGFQTTAIQDGQQALDFLKIARPAIVILDLHLPTVSGKEILVEIKNDQRLTETKVILATADPQLADQIATEADLILIKPIGFIQLRNLAARLRE